MDDAIRPELQDSKFEWWNGYDVSLLEVSIPTYSNNVRKKRYHYKWKPDENLEMNPVLTVKKVKENIASKLVNWAINSRFSKIAHLIGVHMFNQCCVKKE